MIRSELHQLGTLAWFGLLKSLTLRQMVSSVIVLTLYLQGIKKQPISQFLSLRVLWFLFPGDKKNHLREASPVLVGPKRVESQCLWISKAWTWAVLALRWAHLPPSSAIICRTGSSHPKLLHQKWNIRPSPKAHKEEQAEQLLAQLIYPA